MKHYDFILFENYHLATHHKIDLYLIAQMLQHEGLNVAILNIYGEDATSSIKNIPIINLPFPAQVPNDEWQRKPKNKIHSFFATLILLKQQHTYIKKVIKTIIPLADNFYIGSYHLGMSSQFLHINKPCYYWGLRSERMNHFGKHFLKNPIYGIRMIQLKYLFFKNSFQRLFISNEIIMKEFSKLGLSTKRMTIREERCIEDIGTPNLNNRIPELTFLIIGQLRKEKHIETSISAFKLANIPNSYLKLVGKIRNDYTNTITTAINKDKRIECISDFLPYDEFNKWFTKSHFVLFADEQGPSCITNGTMMEALINYRPIIGPNYNPYSYYINKYNIGILYEPGNIIDYANALKKAQSLGTSYFVPYIKSFLSTILFNKVSKKFISDLKENSYNLSK